MSVDMKDAVSSDDSRPDVTSAHLSSFLMDPSADEPLTCPVDQKTESSQPQSSDDDANSDYAESDVGDTKSAEDDETYSVTSEDASEPGDNCPRAKSNAKSMKRARDAREYVAQLEAKETMSGQKARVFKQGGALATQAGDGAVLETVANTLGPLPTTYARTKKEQFKMIERHLQQGGDVRRKKSQKADLELAAKIFGYLQVKPRDGKWFVQGMISLLESYQLIAAAWMIRREVGSRHPDGGILADEMGLGKTVTSLTCIAKNPPYPDDIEAYCRATLVVVPNRDVAYQWLAETRKHCDLSMASNVVIFGSEPGFFPDPNHYAQQWVVITTYRQVVLSYSHKEQARDPQPKASSWKAHGSSRANTLLSDIRWYRIILDEAHQIKNVNSTTFAACCSLRSKYRWALSGTPLANSPLELFPYLKFLGCWFTQNLRQFKSTYIKGSDAAANYDALISLVMFRRVRHDSFIGSKIIELPENSIHDLIIPLSWEETAIFDILCEMRQMDLAKVTEDGLRGSTDTDDDDSSCYEIFEESSNEPIDVVHRQESAVVATQLRQAVSHLYTLESMFRNKLSADSIQHLINVLQEPQKKATPRQTNLEQLTKSDNYADGLGKYPDGVLILQDFGKKSTLTDHAIGGGFNFTRPLSYILAEKQASNTTCLLCKRLQPPRTPTQNPVCGHVFCRDCYLIARDRARGNQTSVDSRCPHAGCEAFLEKGVRVKTLAKLSDSVDKSDPPLHCGEDLNGIELPRSPEQDTLFRVGRYPSSNLPMLPSSKLTAVLGVILHWLKHNPEDKIIVFTQFVMTGRMLGWMLQLIMGHSTFVYYFGCMAPGRRLANLHDFKTNPDAKIMIGSLRAGGQSLNITEANRMILVDPWWNKVAEQQALGRILRRGQDKPVHLVRILLSEGIDQRIMDLQEGKSTSIASALQDDGHKPQALTRQQMEKLFTCDEDDDGTLEDYDEKHVNKRKRSAQKSKATTKKGGNRRKTNANKKSRQSGFSSQALGDEDV